MEANRGLEIFPPALAAFPVTLHSAPSSCRCSPGPSFPGLISVKASAGFSCFSKNGSPIGTVNQQRPHHQSHLIFARCSWNARPDLVRLLISHFGRFAIIECSKSSL